MNDFSCFPQQKRFLLLYVKIKLGTNQIKNRKTQQGNHNIVIIIKENVLINDFFGFRNVLVIITHDCSLLCTRMFKHILINR